MNQYMTRMHSCAYTDRSMIQRRVHSASGPCKAGWLRDSTAQIGHDWKITISRISVAQDRCSGHLPVTDVSLGVLEEQHDLGAIGRVDSNDVRAQKNVVLGEVGVLPHVFVTLLAQRAVFGLIEDRLRPGCPLSPEFSEFEAVRYGECLQQSRRGYCPRRPGSEVHLKLIEDPMVETKVRIPTWEPFLALLHGDYGTHTLRQTQ